MRLFLLTTLTMMAFAANSLLNRMALLDGSIGAIEFGSLRVASGAIALFVIHRVVSGGALFPEGVTRHALPVAALSTYIFGFSLAYIVLETGAGALILFGGVQITMFIGALLLGEKISPARWTGAALALGGLTWLLWPAEGTPPLIWATLMGAAAVGWGIYTLWGQRAGAPLRNTAANFLLAVPVAALLSLLMVAQPLFTAKGVALALLSGVVTSGLGYALWYSVLPDLRPSTAALAQLSVPIIAAVAGFVFLGEPLTSRFVIAAALVLGGIALAVLWPQRTIGSRGS